MERAWHHSQPSFLVQAEDEDDVIAQGLKDSVDSSQRIAEHELASRVARATASS